MNSGYKKWLSVCIATSLLMLIGYSLFPRGTQENLRKVILTAPVFCISPQGRIPEWRNPGDSDRQPPTDKAAVIQRSEFLARDTTGMVVYVRSEQKSRFMGFWGDAFNPPHPIVFAPAVTPRVNDVETAGTIHKGGWYSAPFVQNYHRRLTVSSPAVNFEIDTVGPKASLEMTSAPKEMPEGEPTWFGGTQRNIVHITVQTESNVTWFIEFMPADSGNSKEYRLPLRDFLEKVTIDPATPNIPDSINENIETDWMGELPAGSEEREFNTSTGSSDNPSLLPYAQQLPDGVWNVQLSAFDSAGNEGRSNTLELIKETVPHSGETIALSGTLIRPGTFSGPNELTVSVAGCRKSEVESFAFSIADDSGEVVFEKSFGPGQAISWQGQKTNGLPAPEGSYSTRLIIQYLNGDSSLIEGDPVQVGGYHSQGGVSIGEFSTIADPYSVNSPLYTRDTIAQGSADQVVARLNDLSDCCKNERGIFLLNKESLSN